MRKIIINIIIGIVVFIGFFIYWGRAEGWFKEGGFVYEWWKNKRKKIKRKKKR